MKWKSSCIAPLTADCRHKSSPTGKIMESGNERNEFSIGFWTRKVMEIDGYEVKPSSKFCEQPQQMNGHTWGQMMSMKLQKIHTIYEEDVF